MIKPRIGKLDVSTIKNIVSEIPPIISSILNPIGVTSVSLL